jgi:uncharacterized protein GlcG (DUF336 family)
MVGRRELIKQATALLASGLLLQEPLDLGFDRPAAVVRAFDGVPDRRSDEMTAENVVQRASISSDAAARAVAAATAEANKTSVPVTIVVVDESGSLKEMRRMDGAPLVSIQTAINKAYAAAAIGLPTDDFYTAIEGDAAAVASFATRPGLALIAGGIPIHVNNAVAGAVGVAGALTGAEDKRIAQEAARTALA